ncbi:Uncharacterised protein [Raoultella terrigena]|uniref:Uncharacterized protein n=1 Tax=Raoultella terrigena TaxID=577 RepID=A0A4U9CVZ9_RAOTE|nr:Uncharacterised protein [Raoultella terrigena]
MRVNFAVEQHEVVAEYLVVLDKRKLDAAQQTILTREYKATALDSEHLGVLFKASGYWTAGDPNELEESWRLSSPVVVSINDRTQTLSTLGNHCADPAGATLPAGHDVRVRDGAVRIA